jgi:uncharacterized protein (TIGR02145 family)
MKKATIALLLICVAAFAQQKGSFTDTRDKKTYKTVKIGEQTWMAENLNYDVKGSRCYGDNSGADSKNRCVVYGRLYNWETAKKVCPSGWHLPTEDEWNVMTAYVGDTEGKKLKSSSGCKNDDSGTDEFGFSALPGGTGGSDGSFSLVGDTGYWWGANEGNSYRNSYRAYFRYMTCYDDGAYWDYINKSNLFSVRCVQD